jgi:dTDP-4-dehydrorhamnose 3,5-epimerase
MTPQEIAETYIRLGYVGIHATPLQIPLPQVRQVGSCQTVDLNWLVDPRGALMEVHRESWHTYAGRAVNFGTVAQVYVSVTRPGVVKGWHAHTRQTDRFVVVRGAVTVSLCDLTLPADARMVHEVTLDCTRGPRQLVIPPGVAHGWKALEHHDGEAWVLNCCSHEYDGTDEFRRPAWDGPTNDLAYDWNQCRDG